jgi:hypothetical protein
MTVIEGINVFLNITGGRRCIRVFKLAVYLGTGARLVVLFRRLYICNLLLPEGPSCLIAIAFYKVSIGFPFRSSENLREE